MDGQTDGRMEGWIGGWMDVWNSKQNQTGGWEQNPGRTRHHSGAEILVPTFLHLHTLYLWKVRIVIILQIRSLRITEVT